MFSPKEYNDFLSFKLKSADYHYKQCIDAETNPNLFEDTDQQIIATSSEFTAMMLVYQSTLDLLAQFINRHRHLKLSSSSLYFSTVMINVEKIPDMKESLNNLNANAIYLIDYCNTTKHRNLIKISEQWTFITPFQPMKLLLVSPFKKDGRSYDEKVLLDISREIHESFTQSIKTLINLV
ncbi:hypothetical protein ACFPYN_03130 [Paenisporosarcina macmurdoensis]|uniref:Uncharacterized protein n=1 Tax=Paenisporosarcina macmurdoensis TaxID=212659 RepID=A0ABW1L4L9_9BACL